MESVRSDAEASFGGRVQDSIQSEVRSRLHSGSETGAQNVDDQLKGHTALESATGQSDEFKGTSLISATESFTADTMGHSKRKRSDAIYDGNSAQNDFLDSATVEGEELLKPYDRLLPIANVSRIMKNSLPENSKLAKEAKECVQECVSEFISFVISEAADICIQGKRKLVNGEDVLYALKALGFDNYFEVMKVYLHRYREFGRNEELSQLNGDVLDPVTESLILSGQQGHQSHEI